MDSEASIWDAETYGASSTMAPDGITGYFDLKFLDDGANDGRAIGVFDTKKDE